MALVLTEEQESLRRTARDFVQEKLPVSHFRQLRDRRDPMGFSRDIWKEMGQLRFVGAAIPETYGGTGLGYAELGLILEECGRTLAPTPFQSTVLLAGNAILLGESEALRSEVLPPLCVGERILAFAHEEGFHHEPRSISAQATRSADGYHITGDKVFVLDATSAEAFVVVARLDSDRESRDGLGLFFVPARNDGIEIKRTPVIDHRNTSRVRFNHVRVPAEALIGNQGVLDKVLDRATACLAAEMLGGIQQAFDETIAYLKTRKQFGVPIGSFQALKHRAANMFCEIELTRSIVMEALRAIDENRSDTASLVSIAKARASDTFIHVSSEAIQMHGGIGVTDELDIGFYYKRARVTEMNLGTSAYHRDRFARLNGY